MQELPRYLIKAKQTYEFHRSKLVENSAWRISDSARVLRRSIGSISEDLLIARWSRSHETKLAELEYAYQALKFIRQKEKDRDMEEIE